MAIAQPETEHSGQEVQDGRRALTTMDVGCQRQTQPLQGVMGVLGQHLSVWLSKHLWQLGWLAQCRAVWPACMLCLRQWRSRTEQLQKHCLPHPSVALSFT